MVRRVVAAGLLAVGLLMGLLGWWLLPGDAGRLAYAIEIADTRPPSDRTVPPGLTALGAVRAVAVAADPGDDGVARLLLLPTLSGVLTAADTELGRLPVPAAAGSHTPRVPEAVAGADTSLELGRTTVDGMTVDVVGLLCPLGAAFDSSVLAAHVPGGKGLEAGASVRYFLLPSSWEERGRTLARLRAEPALLAGLGAEAVGSAGPPPLSRRVILAAAVLLICLGMAVMALQTRGLTRADIARSFRRS